MSTGQQNGAPADDLASSAELLAEAKQEFASSSPPPVLARVVLARQMGGTKASANLAST